AGQLLPALDGTRDQQTLCQTFSLSPDAVATTLNDFARTGLLVRGHFQAAIEAVTSELLREPPLVKEGFDFYEIAEEIEQLQPDLLIGTSKGYPLARKLQIPLLRVGFPIHDRFGGQRTLHLGYQGTQRLYDQLVNAVLEKKQADSPVGYGYL
ncbi:MAG: hypothetical protein F6K03_14975, partial [Kamptonema sp. SIO4C4]|nr:hypothetical protein [Kamptonema sp. SIO4C4]